MSSQPDEHAAPAEHAQPQPSIPVNFPVALWLTKSIASPATPPTCTLCRVRGNGDTVRRVTCCDKDLCAPCAVGNVLQCAVSGCVVTQDAKDSATELAAKVTALMPRDPPIVDVDDPQSLIGIFRTLGAVFPFAAARSHAAVTANAEVSAFDGPIVTLVSRAAAHRRQAAATRTVESVVEADVLIDDARWGVTPYGHDEGEVWHRFNPEASFTDDEHMTVSRRALRSLIRWNEPPEVPAADDGDANKCSICTQNIEHDPDAAPFAALDGSPAPMPGTDEFYELVERHRPSVRNDGQDDERRKAAFNGAFHMRTACGHVFHVDCLEKWLVGHGKATCPNCRDQVPAVPSPIVDDAVLADVNAALEEVRAQQELAALRWSFLEQRAPGKKLLLEAFKKHAPNGSLPFDSISPCYRDAFQGLGTGMEPEDFVLLLARCCAPYVAGVVRCEQALPFEVFRLGVRAACFAASPSADMAALLKGYETTAPEVAVWVKEHVEAIKKTVFTINDSAHLFNDHGKLLRESYDAFVRRDHFEGVRDARELSESIQQAGAANAESQSSLLLYTGPVDALTGLTDDGVCQLSIAARKQLCSDKSKLSIVVKLTAARVYGELLRRRIGAHDDLDTPLTAEVAAWKDIMGKNDRTDCNNALSLCTAHPKFRFFQGAEQSEGLETVDTWTKLRLNLGRIKKALDKLKQCDPDKYDELWGLDEAAGGGSAAGAVRRGAVGDVDMEDEVAAAGAGTVENKENANTNDVGAVKGQKRKGTFRTAETEAAVLGSADKDLFTTHKLTPDEFGVSINGFQKLMQQKERHGLDEIWFFAPRREQVPQCLRQLCEHIERVYDEKVNSICVKRAQPPSARGAIFQRHRALEPNTSVFTLATAPPGANCALCFYKSGFVGLEVSPEVVAVANTRRESVQWNSRKVPIEHGALVRTTWLGNLVCTHSYSVTGSPEDTACTFVITCSTRKDEGNQLEAGGASVV